MSEVAQTLLRDRGFVIDAVKHLGRNHIRRASVKLVSKPEAMRAGGREKRSITRRIR